MLHDRLDVAMIRMENGDVESLRPFTRTIRHVNEIVLRFTHRCRRHDSSDQPLARDLYRLRAGQLGTAVLDDGVRNEVLPTPATTSSAAPDNSARRVLRCALPVASATQAHHLLAPLARRADAGAAGGRPGHTTRVAVFPGQ